MEETRQVLAAKFQVIFPHLDERQRRLLMGAEARALGHGGIRLVAQAAWVREATVSLGVDELDSGADPLGRVRRPGGGRKRAADLDPGLRPALLALVEQEERGDPMSPLRWTTKSTRKLAGELTRQGHRVSAGTVGDLLRGESAVRDRYGKRIQPAVRDRRADRIRARGSGLRSSSSGSRSSEFEALFTTSSAMSMTRLPRLRAAFLSRSKASRVRRRWRSARTPMACSTRTRAVSACSSWVTVTASRAASSASFMGRTSRRAAGGVPACSVAACVVPPSVVRACVEDAAEPEGAEPGGARSAASRSASTMALVRSDASSSPTTQPRPDLRTTVSPDALAPLI
jgi:Rhodopirellula transposase DDE domain